jgi:hypothetical protein
MLQRAQDEKRMSYFRNEDSFDSLNTSNYSDEFEYQDMPKEIMSRQPQNGSIDRQSKK